MSYVKYYVYKQQVSNDSGTTWSDTSPLVTTPSGDPIGTYDTLSACTGSIPTPIYRTTSGTPYCTGYDKYVEVYSQVSYDSGSTWTTTATTPTLVEANSEDCGYVPPTPPSPSGYSDQYLTMEIHSLGTIGFWMRNRNISLSYSLTDGRSWVTLDDDIWIFSLNVSTGDKILWKGVEKGITHATGSTVCFSGTAKCEVYGNVMSLVYGNNFTGQTELYRGIFSNLFGNFYGFNVTSAENLVLPATTLARECYAEMFLCCTSLRKSPVLPATTLADACYAEMFGGMYGDYEGVWVWRGCTSLSGITCLATDISATNCTSNWVQGVSSTGTFYKNPSMTSWSTGNDGIPSGWTVTNYTG